MSKSILLIRHAESANNALPECQRVPDPGLTQRGVEQAQRLVAALAGRRIAHLHCSPFLRSLETTRPTAEHLQMTPMIISDIYEQGGCYSGYEEGLLKGEPGMSRSELAARYSGWHIDPLISEHGWNSGRDYETDEEVKLRARNVACRLHAAWPSLQDGCDMALVIHADFKRVLIAEMLLSDGWPGSEQPIWNTGISRLVLSDDRWELIEWNSADHLPGELRTPVRSDLSAA